MKKRLCSALLCLSLCLGLLPAAALAADSTSSAPSSGARESTYAIDKDITEMGLDLSEDRPTEETVYTAGEGTVTYIPASGAGPDRLILDNATVNYDGSGCAIRLSQLTTVELIGENVIRSTTGDAIYLSSSDYSAFDQELKLVSTPHAGQERGSLRISGGGSGITNLSGGITLDSMALYVEATRSFTRALGAWGDLTVRNSKVFLGGHPHRNYNVLLAEAVDIDADSAVQAIALGHSEFTSLQTVCCTGLTVDGQLYTNGSIDTSRYLNYQNDDSTAVGPNAKLTATYLSTGAMTVSQGAQVNTLHVWTPDDEDDFRYTFTVYGEVSLPEMEYYDEALYSLVLTEDSSLYLPEDLTLDLSRGTNDLSKGALTVDGTLILPDDFTPEQLRTLHPEGAGFIIMGNRVFTTLYEQYFTAGDLNFTLPAAQGGWKEDAALETDGYAWQEREDRYTLALRRFYHLDRTITLPTDKDVDLILSGVNYLGCIAYDPAACQGEDFLSRLTVTGEDSRARADLRSDRFGVPPLRYPNVTIGNGAVLTVSGGPALAVMVMPDMQDTPDGVKITGGDLVLDGGKLTARIQTSEPNYSRGMSGPSAVFANTVTVRSGSLEASAPCDYTFMALSALDSVTVEGGTVRLAGDIGLCASRLFLRGGEVHVNPSSMDADDATCGILLYVQEENGSAGFHMTGGTLSAQGGQGALLLNSYQEPSFHLSEGIEISPKEAACKLVSTQDYFGDTVWIGAFTTDPELQLDEGALFPENACTRLELAVPSDSSSDDDDSDSSGPVSSSGSSGAGSSSSGAVTNPDGSQTTTQTDRKTGTLTETTQFTDGSTQVVERAKDGAVTTTQTSADGVKSVTAETANGKVTAHVTLPDASSSVAVTIPVSKDLGPGVVAVLVNADGTKTVVQKSVAVDGGLQVTLDGSANLELVDNAKSFSDVPSQTWFTDAAAFVSAREMMTGTSDAGFSPAMTATRGMVTTLLARYEGQDTSGGAEWYTKGMEWAKEVGISDGTDPEGVITREQLAAMLYRYAGSPEAEGAMGMAGYTDADSISPWAGAAMRWAVLKGIITGKGGAESGRLDPKGQCSRAELAVILMRYCTK